jgi:hypothetical protein
MPDQTPASFRHTLRILCGALLGSQIVMLLAVSAALGATAFDEPPLWALVVVVIVGAAEAVVLSVFGYRVPAIAPGMPDDERRSAVVRAVQSSTVLRFAIAEAVAIISVALAFVVGDGGAVVCTIGVAISLTLSALHVWPSERVVARIREGLERDGGVSHLDEVLDAPPPPARG